MKFPGENLVIYIKRKILFFIGIEKNNAIEREREIM